MKEWQLRIADELMYEMNITHEQAMEQAIVLWNYLNN